MKLHRLENTVQLDSDNPLLKCEECPSSHLCIPSFLERPEYKWIDEMSVLRSPLHRSFVLFDVGDQCSHIFKVRSGVVKTTNYDENGNQNITGIYLPGDTLGFDGVATRTHRVRATTLATSSVCEIRFDKFERLAMENYRVMRSLLDMYSAQLSNDEKLIKILNMKSSIGKLSALIMDFSSRQKVRKYSDKSFSFVLSRNEVACVLGVAHETVSRMFSVLEKRNLIEYKNRQLTIHNKKELLACCSRG